VRSIFLWKIPPFFAFAALLIGALSGSALAGKDQPQQFLINTSNEIKYRDYFKLLGDQLVGRSAEDLHEVESDPITVVVQKASQYAGTSGVPSVLVDDTTLEVEGADVGVNLRWWVESGRIHRLVGRHATWTVLIAYRKGNRVRVFRGSVSGTLVEPKGDKGFGFDAYFAPDGGGGRTLADGLPDALHARWRATQEILRNHGEWYPAITKWKGLWQNDSAACFTENLREVLGH
jgi:XTP/dITP diphosphohydrolase